MKKLRYILYTLMLLAVGCSTEFEAPMADSTTGRVAITIDRQALVSSRAVASNEAEAQISHIDVLFFAADNTLYHHERVSAEAYQGTLYLTKARKDFEAMAAYSVYLIANSTLAAQTFAAVENSDQLFNLTQSDERIHMTGLKSVNDAPQYFLMDGQAYLTADGTEPMTKGAVVVNNGVQAEDTALSCTLRRAAVKVIVTLTKGSNVRFTPNYHAGYYFRNMPYNTLLVDQYTHRAKLRTPDKSTSAQFFHWGDNNEQVVVVGYFYSHDRNGESFFERGTSLVVNVPLEYTIFDSVTGLATTEQYENNYYQLQLSKTGKFERNHIYKVSATINAPGAEEISTPVEITDTSYSVIDWNSQSVYVGGENGPKYLKVNREQMEMHNVAVDSSTLQFASSDPVKIAINSVSYIDKFGQKQDITNRASSYNISATPLSELSGNIEVRSNVPTNNTIRYIDMRVYQDDNGNNRHDSNELYQDITVLQYPVIYITNQRGYYSYREDFDCHYQYMGTRNVAVGLEMSGTRWTGKYKYGTDSYSGNSANSNYFWASKYVSGDGSTAGMSVRSYYNWPSNSSASTAQKDGNANTNDNARMYHVRVTATSADYVVARPRITDGYTDSGDDNSMIVSPSFMIASRLGAMFAEYGGLSNINNNDDDNNNGITDRLEIFRDHCKNYAETYIDASGNVIHFTDWRLPTAAELQIIISLQGTSGVQADAIDYLLNGAYYMSANGPVYNSKKNTNDDIHSSAIRCIRDAY